MSKKRGLSRDEKKETIIGIFRETKEPYAIQDMEKVAAKKGVGTHLHVVCVNSWNSLRSCPGPAPPFTDLLT